MQAARQYSENTLPQADVHHVQFGDSSIGALSGTGCLILSNRHRISGMCGDLSRSIVPVVRATANGAPGELVGTGIVVTPTVVITCGHVVDELFEGDSLEGQELDAFGVLCVSLSCRITYARRSDTLDLCCLHFDSLPEMSPAPLVRSARLTNLELAAIGFSPGEAIAQHDVPELEVIQEERYGGWLQAAQFGSGLPDGFSGAPVLAEAEGSGRIIGMLCMGGQSSATSWMLAVDPIASFLVKEGIELAIANLATVVPQVRPRAATTLRIRAGRDFSRNVVRVRADDIAMTAGRDFLDSDVELNHERPQTN